MFVTANQTGVRDFAKKLIFVNPVKSLIPVKFVKNLILNSLIIMVWVINLVLKANLIY